jgi:hypothetical protein
VTTPLVKPLTREILVSGTAYKVTITAEHLKLVRKGGRRGIEITWDDLLAFEQRADAAIAPVAASATGERSRTPARSILNEVAQDLRAASTALARADDVLTQAGALPPALMAQAAADPVYGRAAPLEHWFVEPLLTVVEVASILRVSTRAVRRLGLRTIRVGSEERYQQSIIREYMRAQEMRTDGRRR